LHNGLASLNDNAFDNRNVLAVTLVQSRLDR